MNRIVLTNQHTDNRGDESATTGAINSLRKYFGADSEIAVYLPPSNYQFLPDHCSVIEKPMLIGARCTLEMIIWIFLKLIKIDIREFCSRRLNEFISDHEKADIIISSCGGPYIGDIYINHEFIHILHLALPLLLNKKITFFAPSMGPFHNKVMNYFRKLILDRADAIILRDSISYQYVLEFLPGNKAIYLTTDACLADDLDLGGVNKKPGTIGFTPLDYKYPLAKDKLTYKRKYENVVVGVLDKLMEEDPGLRVEFFPQLYGKHSDIPFIKKIIGLLKYPDRTIVFSDQLSGRDQQKEIASLDYMIATRYHSAIFACKVNTPVVCIAYEHKIIAFMNSIRLGDYLLDIYDLDESKLWKKIALLKDNYAGIKRSLRESMPNLHTLSNKTAEIIYMCMAGSKLP